MEIEKLIMLIEEGDNEVDIILNYSTIVDYLNCVKQQIGFAESPRDICNLINSALKVDIWNVLDTYIDRAKEMIQFHIDSKAIKVEEPVIVKPIIPEEPKPIVQEEPRKAWSMKQVNNNKPKSDFGFKFKSK